MILSASLVIHEYSIFLFKRVYQYSTVTHVRIHVDRKISTVKQLYFQAYRAEKIPQKITVQISPSTVLPWLKSASTVLPWLKSASTVNTVAPRYYLLLPHSIHY